MIAAWRAAWRADPVGTMLRVSGVVWGVLVVAGMLLPGHHAHFDFDAIPSLPALLAVVGAVGIVGMADWLEDHVDVDEEDRRD